MEIRIGIAETSQVLEIDLAENAELDDVKDKITSALDGKSSSVWFEDRKNQHIVVSADSISFVEINAADSERKIGFGI